MCLESIISIFWIELHRRVLKEQSAIVTSLPEGVQNVAARVTVELHAKGRQQMLKVKQNVPVTGSVSYVTSLQFSAQGAVKPLSRVPKVKPVPLYIKTPFT